ncbi:hypothetical protein CGCTS75_v009379 [Colletotrichum tropicale]|nr:hypothetical protein CGCTS75_v009379 [Colletotrichum tropicale]
MGILILSLGTISILASVSFLVCLWQGAMAAETGETNRGRLWNLIVFSDWTSRAITVSSAIIRVMLSLQMGVFTAMTASLMLERTGVPLTSAPLVSLLRAISASPYNLVTFTSFNLPWRTSGICSAAVGVSVLLTAISQFTSTILLSDLGNVDITSPQQSVSMNYLNKDSGGVKGTWDGSKVWHSAPGTYFRFAEHPRTHTPAQEAEDFEDTGRLLRAFLPFVNEESRMRLQKYDGPATVLDSRVVCHRPLLSNVTFSYSSKSFDDNDYLSDVFIRGNLTFNVDGNDPRSPLEYFDGGPWGFNCVAPTKHNNTALNWQASICSVNGGALALGGIMSTPRLIPGVILQLTNLFLVFNSTEVGDDWRKSVQEHGVENPNTHLWDSTVDQLGLDSSSEGVWTRFDSAEDTIGMAVSACFSNFGASIEDVKMSSTTNGIPRSVVWDRRASQYNTDGVRIQYHSVDDKIISHEERGILRLEWKDGWDLNPVTRNGSINSLAVTGFFAVASDLPFVVRGPLNITDELNPCGTLQVGGYSTRAVHCAHASLFQNVIRETGSLPEALQELFTILEQMKYYEELPYYNMGSAATFILAEEKLIPVRWLGFGIVISIIGVHFGLLITTMTLFLRLTRSSYLGNIWMFLSQVFSPETADIIQKGTETKDDEVEGIMSKVTTGSEVGTLLRRKVRMKANEMNGRKELMSA